MRSTVIETQNGEFEVQIGFQVGSRRRFKVPQIPLNCVVEVLGPEAPELRYYEQEQDLEVPPQELYTSTEYYDALSDESMESHAQFVIGVWSRQRSGE